MRTLIKFLIIVSLFCFFVNFNSAPEKIITVAANGKKPIEQVNCLASVLYYEANNQDLDSQKSVAFVILNESIQTKKSPCVVVQKVIGNAKTRKWKEIQTSNPETVNQLTIVAGNLYWLRLPYESLGISFIKNAEGFVDHPYPDAGGLSIGYGTFLTPVLMTKYIHATISIPQAEELLINTKIEIDLSLHDLVTVPLNENQVAALESFCYNAGTAHFASSDLLALLNKSDYAGAAKQFSKWVYVRGKKFDGLVSRRKQESDLFLLK